MFGVIVNAVAILVGSCLGVFFKKLVTPTLAKRMQWALGYCTLLLGIKMGLKFENVLVVISCVVGGGVMGTLLQIENRSQALALRVQKFFPETKKEGQGFATGMMQASVLFCTGAMAVVGSIQSGVTGDHEVLFTKALLDGITSMTFSAIYGIGVAFSAVAVLVYQGMITLFAGQLSVLSNPHVLNEISGVGGVLLCMIGVHMSEIKKVPVGDYLPAMILVMVVAALRVM
jgi:uncharacterized membrane protein YqgA involved in biofilm formation